MSTAGKQGVRGVLAAYRALPAWQRWLAAAAWMGLIFCFSAQPVLPHAPNPLLDVVLKKLAHATVYAILSLLLWGALPRDSFWLAFLLSVVYAITDEVHQVFVPGRHGWIVDVAVDGVGALLAALAIRQIVGAARK